MEPIPPATTTASNTGADDRAFWVSTLEKIARPVLTALANRQLRATMPVELNPGSKTERASCTHLEAMGRLLAGMAPWLELPPDDTAEGKLRTELLDLALKAIDSGTDPKSPDFLNFNKGSQPLVDSAFFGHALLRAPSSLWKKLSPAVQGNVVAALQSSRVIKPAMSNWLLFSAMVEAALCGVGQEWKTEPVAFAISKHMEWYKGDGLYGDGPNFHFDYYNSFVIQPMLLDVLETVSKQKKDWDYLHRTIVDRCRRYAMIQEKLISPEGALPAIGRSLAYRFGALQLLGMMTLRKQLPGEIAPGQVRGGMTAVIRRLIKAPGTFDQNGWLTIGFCGHQPTIAEAYISTGSLYLCAVGLLPLGLPASDEFWTCDAMDWSSRRVYGGLPVNADHAIGD
jgi:hypothetical protein